MQSRQNLVSVGLIAFGEIGAMTLQGNLSTVDYEPNFNKTGK